MSKEQGRSSIGRFLRLRLADGDRRGSVAFRARQRRWSSLMETFPDLSDMRVLDLGGTRSFWATATTRPAELTLINPFPGEGPNLDWAAVVLADACRPPHEVRTRRYDLVYSNSTIEHVGGHARREEFAKVASEMAPHMWVQTPYRYFPVEPHFMFPLLQHLPLTVRTEAARRWPLSPPGFPTDFEGARDELMTIELLSIAEMASYFPEASIRLERMLALPKSIIAVR